MWEPIETARDTLRDSQARLVWCPVYRNIYIATWVVPLDEQAKPDPANGFWAHFGSGYRLNERPTRWTMLPEPPEPEA